MIRLDIEPGLIGKRHFLDYPNRERFNTVRFGGPLIELVEKNGWRNIPRVPVFILPKGLPHKYVLADGHYRHDTALRLGLILPCNVYGKRDRLGDDKDGLAPCWMLDDSIRESYDGIISLYLSYQGIQRKPRRIFFWR